MGKLNNFIKSRAFIITLTLTFIALIIAGVTYAWFTWTSTDNTNITMQIGEYTTVTYTGGNAINVNNLAPVYNYTDGESTTFSLTNNNTDVFKAFNYNVYLDITSISNELKTTQFKYVLLDGSNNIVDQGNFSTVSNNSTLTITENKSLPNGNSSYTFLLYIDGNEQNNSNMMNKSLTGSLRVVVNGENIVLEPNPISDYEYTLFPKSETDLDKDYILLTKYIGTSPNVVVPNTYTVDNVEYKTVLYFYDRHQGMTYNYGTFYNNSIITDVILPSDYLLSTALSTKPLSLTNTSMDSMFYNCINLISVKGIPDSVTNMSNTFRGCTSLVSAPIIPNSVTNMSSTFYGCTSLVSAPIIPNSVTNMVATFYGCTSLVSAPIIPSSVTTIASAFLNCTSLVDAPEIPNSVTSMIYTFSGCTSLVKAPEIPNSVIYFGSAFRGCTSLEGIVRINSTNLFSLSANTVWNNGQYGYHPFYETVKSITVEVPEGSTTYTNLNNNKPANVTITTFTP